MFDIIVFGNATRDVILKSEHFKVHRDKRFDTGWAESFAFGDKVDVDEMHVSVGGGGVNTATTFARLGFHTALVGKVGQDEAGNAVVDHLAQEQISHEHFISDPNTETAYSTVLLANSGERTVLVYRGQEQQFTKKELDPSDLTAAWFYITSLSGEIDLLKKILERAHKKHMKVAINPGLDELTNKHFPKLLQYVDILILNKEEAHTLIPNHAKQTGGIFPQIFQLMQGICIITDGTNGAACSSGKTNYFIGAPKIDAVDRLGTGDAFGSGFVSGYVRSGGIIEHALQVAVTNASSVCGHHGSTTGIIHSMHKLLDLPIHVSEQK